MRGLTATEREALLAAATPHSFPGESVEFSDAELGAGESLEERGLVQQSLCPACTDVEGVDVYHYDVTADGLLALRLDALARGVSA